MKLINYSFVYRTLSGRLSAMARKTVLTACMLPMAGEMLAIGDNLSLHPDKTFKKIIHI